jgi:RHS repeat-associated protein
VTAERRLAAVEAALTPAELVVAWLTEAHAFGSLEHAVRSMLAAEEPVPPMDRLARAASDGARTRMKGRSVEERSKAIDTAVSETIFRFRLVRACDTATCAASGNKVEYTYDGQGHRTEVKTTSSSGSVSTTDFTFAGDAIVAEKLTDAGHPTGAVVRTFVVDRSGAIEKMTIAAGEPGAGTYIVAWNGHGDALNLSQVQGDGSLKLANAYTYSTWGAPTTATYNALPDLNFRFLYVGRQAVQWDNSFGMGLFYMQARYYSPILGRFLQPDPAAEGNLYVYANNAPTVMVDPTGAKPSGWYSFVRSTAYKSANGLVFGASCTVIGWIVKSLALTVGCWAGGFIIQSLPDKVVSQTYVRRGRVLLVKVDYVSAGKGWAFVRWQDMTYDHVPGGQLSNAEVCAEAIAGFGDDVFGYSSWWAISLDCGPVTPGSTVWNGDY